MEKAEVDRAKRRDTRCIVMRSAQGKKRKRLRSTRMWEGEEKQQEGRSVAIAISIYAKPAGDREISTELFYKYVQSPRVCTQLERASPLPPPPPQTTFQLTPRSPFLRAPLLSSIFARSMVCTPKPRKYSSFLLFPREVLTNVEEKQAICGGAQRVASMRWWGGVWETVGTRCCILLPTTYRIAECVHNETSRRRIATRNRKPSIFQHQASGSRKLYTSSIYIYTNVYHSVSTSLHLFYTKSKIVCHA